VVHEIMILAANSHHAMVVPGWIYKFILQARSLAVVCRARSVLLGLGSPPSSSTDLRAMLRHACAFPNPCYRTPSGTQRPVAGSSRPSRVIEASLGAEFILPPCFMSIVDYGRSHDPVRQLPASALHVVSASPAGPPLARGRGIATSRHRKPAVTSELMNHL
jgi:hypothetical protein